MTSTKWSALKKVAEDATRPVPNDWYDLVVEKTEVRTASTGSLMIVTKFRIDAGPHQGRAQFTNFVFSPDNPNALIFFFRNMAAFGLGDQFFASLEAMNQSVEQDLQVIANTLVGRSVRAEIGSKVYQGQPRNEIQQFALSGGVNGGVPTPGATVGPPVPSAQGGAHVPPVPGGGAPPVPPAPPAPAAPSAPPVPAGVAPTSGAPSTPPPPVPSF